MDSLKLSLRTNADWTISIMKDGTELWMKFDAKTKKVDINAPLTKGFTRWSLSIDVENVNGTKESYIVYPDILDFKLILNKIDDTIKSPEDFLDQPANNIKKERKDNTYFMHKWFEKYFGPEYQYNVPVKLGAYIVTNTTHPELMWASNITIQKWSDVYVVNRGVNLVQPLPTMKKNGIPVTNPAEILKILYLR